MANPLFDMLNPNAQANSMQSQFDQFKATVNGDPEAIVKNLLNTGRMTQQQFNQLPMMANALTGKLH